MARRLLPTHPLLIKFEKLQAFLEEVGLEIFQHPYDGLVIEDTETNIQARVHDNDDGDIQDSIPPMIEYKLIRIEK